MAKRQAQIRLARLLACTAVGGLLALAAAGCTTLASPETTGALGATPAVASAADTRHDVEDLGARYRANPHDVETAIKYAQALRENGQRSQAAAVLEQAAMRDPDNKRLLGAYGRALADVGNYSQALEVLGRAHSPDQPDWHILSAQGAVLDQMDRHEEAQRYYASALKIAPDEPSVLSNLGLSYALSRDLTRAEATLRRATTQARVFDPRVRQNLALVVGLQGRFTEAENIARADLPPDEAAANVAYLRDMLARKSDWKKIARPASAVDSGG
jgi:Flp pilus assembly protein TadD